MAARWKFLIALWTVYIVWGSTYVAIKISVRTLPAFLSAGLRFLLAGAVLALILMLSGRSSGSRGRSSHLRHCSASRCSGSVWAS